MNDSTDPNQHHEGEGQPSEAQLLPPAVIPAELVTPQDAEQMKQARKVKPQRMSEEAANTPVPPTGDTIGQNLIYWLIMMVASAGILILLLLKQRKDRK